ncbi:UNVERIFIED_CONTAM: hypothetical protein GTU68_063637 [Idotea baltica]|nr:hypothetical protein [Idotea baltica]
MIRLRVATNDSFKSSSGDKVEDTQWHTVIAWGKTAEHISLYVHKGNEVAISGKLIHRLYEDSYGVRRVVTEVIANEFLNMDRKAS